MADSKKYDGSQWEHSLRKMTTATAEIEPTIYTDGSNITTYTIKGNTVQNGTPTPSNPVDVNGVGERTENLFDVNGTYSLKSASVTIADNSINATLGGSGTDRIYYTQTYTAGTYKISFDVLYCEGRLYSDKEFTGSTYNSYYGGYYRAITGTQTITFAEDFTIGFAFAGASGNNAVISNIMFRLSTSTADYEPYGYKIPISTLQGTAVNYLGSVQSYREIAKYIFDGTDNFTWAKSGTRNFSWFFNPAFLPDRGKESTPFLCSHGATVTTLSEFVYGTVYADNTYNLGIFPSELSTVTELRQWLATQYANGTPVTIWYSLYTPTTAAVNEPLMKIGTYADTLSNATAIPTTEGANTITVDTTVQPSEFTATWTGWHNAYVKEKSENLFDESNIQKGYYGNAVTFSSFTSDNRYRAFSMPIKAGTYTIKIQADEGIRLLRIATANEFYDVQTDNQAYTFIISADATIYVSWRNLSTTDSFTNMTVMLNSGQTALPYAPYWK